MAKMAITVSTTLNDHHRFTKRRSSATSLPINIPKSPHLHITTSPHLQIMRLKIVLQPHLTTVLPANYQIQLASYLGVLFNNTEGLFMQRLHQNGYLTPAETVFDAFTFSPIQNEGDKYTFILSLCVDDSFEHVVKSILYEQNERNSREDHSKIMQTYVITVYRYTCKLEEGR